MLLKHFRERCVRLWSSDVRYLSCCSDSTSLSSPQTGAWGCFDEFNRINIEVLSVVAQQILSILSALTANLTRFYFEGFEINLVWSCGIFITMNPGRWEDPVTQGDGVRELGVWDK